MVKFVIRFLHVAYPLRIIPSNMVFSAISLFIPSPWLGTVPLFHTAESNAKSVTALQR
jgi:hypothetical protein